MDPRSQESSAAAPSRERDRARRLFRATLGRLALLYFLPLVVLGVFFHLQYAHLLREGQRAHLEVIAEHQAATFDLFLRERLVNLGNVIDDAGFDTGESALAGYLAGIRQTSDAFVDLAVVSAEGRLVSYVGPVRYPPVVDYAAEGWFRDLCDGGRRSVITEIYLGVRGRPHFTAAVRRGTGGEAVVLRAALSPERLAEYLTTLEGANEVHAAIVNAEGIVQVAGARSAEALRPSPFVPPTDPAKGLVSSGTGTGRPDYAYAWLRETPWALAVTSAVGTGTADRTAFLPMRGAPFVATAAILLVVGTVILVRARQVARHQVATERHEAELSGQLVHAARLASVGELAAGIAHEINNPLAVVAEEVGVLRDSLDPELAEDDEEPLDVAEHLDAIHEAVFRCRDITRKLLTFVRHTEVRLAAHRVDEVLDEVLDTMLGNELSISDVQVIRRYDPGIPPILTDRTQLVQVFVNLVKNALDAMPDGGTLLATTEVRNDRVAVSIRDTGCGMTPEQLERVFVPFFTTKEPGKGTGLGLSVSYGIIRSFGGDFYVSSAPGRGSTFTVELPRTGPAEASTRASEESSCRSE